MKILRLIEKYLITITFAGMCIVILLQVINRNLTKFSIGWFEELARYLMIWMAFVGSAVAYRKGIHVSVDFVVGKLKGRARTAFIIFQNIIIVLFLVFILYAGWNIVTTQLQTGQTTPALKINIGLVYLAVPVWAVLTAAEVIYATLHLGDETEKEEG